ncbi:hypothetical protein [Serratia fonticola]
MFERVADIMILVVSSFVALIFVVPGVNRLVEGPTSILLDKIETASVFDTPGYAILQIMVGLGVMIVGQLLRAKLRD